MGKIRQFIDYRFACAADAYEAEYANWWIGGVEPQLTVIRNAPLPRAPSFKRIAPTAVHYRRCVTRKEADTNLQYFRGQLCARMAMLAFLGLQ